MSVELMPVLPADSPAEAIQALQHLTPVELQQAEAAARALDVRDSPALSAFGVKAQGEMRQLSDPILNAASAQDAGDAGVILSDLLNQVRQLDTSALSLQESRVTRLPFIGQWFSKVRQLLSRFEKAHIKIERIEAALGVARNGLNLDIARLDQLYARNVAMLRSLLVYIAAGEMKLLELRGAQSQTATAQTPPADAVQAQQTADLSNAIVRLERRVFDLRLAALVALQTAPQIRLIQNGNQALVDKIQTSVMLTIPLWQNQLSMAIARLTQQRSAEMQRRVSEQTSKLIRTNADMGRDVNAKTQVQAERFIVDLQDLQYANDQLLATIEDSLKIQSEARQRRKEASAAIERMQQDLRNKLADVGTGRRGDGETGR